MRWHRSLLLMLAIACGDTGADVGGTGGSNAGGGTNSERLAGTPSQNADCASLSGATAVYFDLESGFLVNLSFLPLLEATGGVIAGGDNTTWSFPPGYSAQAIPRGVTIQRDDAAVIFEATTNTPISVDAATAFNSLLQSVLTGLQLQPNDAALICGADVSFSVGPLPGRLVSGIYDAGNARMIVKVEVIDSGPIRTLNTRVAIAPLAEFDAIAGNVFLPMVWAQFLGGMEPEPECSDRVDNDGDTFVDLDDPQCASRDDPDESN